VFHLEVSSLCLEVCLLFHSLSTMAGSLISLPSPPFRSRPCTFTSVSLLLSLLLKQVNGQERSSVTRDEARGRACTHTHARAHTHVRARGLSCGGVSDAGSSPPPEHSVPPRSHLPAGVRGALAFRVDSVYRHGRL